MSDNSVDWRKLREFAGVDLSKSFVLSWGFDRDALLIDVDLLLTPEHPFYEEPRPAEKVCIRPATIEFPFCESVRLNGSDTNSRTAEAIAGFGNGAIIGLKRMNDGPYEIVGDFGTVRIDAERPILKLRSP